MTEAEWQTCTDPKPLLALLKGRGNDRKFRLFGCACCRRVWRLLADNRSRWVIEVTERYEDGEATAEEMDRAAEEADDASEGITTSRLGWSADSLARHATAWVTDLNQDAHRVAAEVAAFAARAAATALAEATTSPAASEAAEPLEQCRLLRCVFGNEFRQPPTIDPSLLTWSDGLVPKLARAAYEDRHLPAGTFDEARLAVLADALDEAGCTDEALVSHLRAVGPHVRGCWAVDLLTGRK